MNVKNIVFYYPSRITGGAEYLFVRCAEWLAENQKTFKIGFVDFKDGFANRTIRSDNIDIYEIEEGQVFETPKDSVVILQLNLISHLHLFNYNKHHTLFLFWALHSLNLKLQYNVKGVYTLTKKDRKYLGDLVTELASHNVINFMSKLSYAFIISDLYQPLCDMEWLPNIIPINESIKANTYTMQGAERLKFCWLGRLDFEKYRNIVTYMNELESINDKLPLSLSLIGVGPAEKNLREKAKQYSYPITFVGEKRDKELDDFIRKETEIGLASGTSTFEFSVRGKPVIVEWVIPKIYKAGIRKSYTLTYESENCISIKKNTVTLLGQNSFENKLNEILDDYMGVSKKCFDFTLKKKPEFCCRQIINIIDRISQLPEDMIYERIEKISMVLNKGGKRAAAIRNIKHLMLAKR